MNDSTYIDALLVVCFAFLAFIGYIDGGLVGAFFVPLGAIWGILLAHSLATLYE